ncbi:hypothetical protein Bbelb_088320 [Branchiostoma belcheri]|nr:hypothetical protein Bbelb_088320 [Branchiostoma belcheri]
MAVDTFHVSLLSPAGCLWARTDTLKSPRILQDDVAMPTRSSKYCQSIFYAPVRGWVSGTSIASSLNFSITTETSRKKVETRVERSKLARLYRNGTPELFRRNTRLLLKRLARRQPSFRKHSGLCYFVSRPLDLPLELAVER